jgi:N-formylmaleamate deformylase
MSEWFSGEVIAHGIKIHYWRTGGEGPPVVLSHGITDNGLCWTRLARALEDVYDVIMPDARGHGFSDAPEEGHSPEDRAADLAGLIRALGLEEPKPILVGHSMGAATTAAAAADYPELVRCAILEDPPWMADALAVSPQEQAARAEEWRADLVERKSQTREEIMAYCRAQQPTWAEVECGPWADSKLQVNFNVLKMLTLPRTPWQGVVRRIACPVLLITADPALGAIVTPEVAREAAGLCRNVEVVHIPGAGHNIRREQFEKYVGAVTAFLGEMQAARL